MLVAYFQIFLGIIFLYFGAEWLVKASASLAIKAGVTPFLVGLTIIGYGTSTPELIVSLDSTWSGNTDIAVGNIIGSNLFNTAFILGIGLLIRPVGYSNMIKRFDTPFMALICLIMWWVGSYGYLGRLGGAIFLLVLVCYSYIAFQFSKKEVRKNGKTPEQLSFPMWNLKKCLPILPISFAFLIVGSHFFLMGSESIARHFGLSDAVIGLTIIAAGTSLPELATTIMASVRKQEQLLIGNIVGSNIYNVLGIIGLMAVIKPFVIGDITNIDYIAMAGINVLFAILVLCFAHLGRIVGAIFLSSYFLYIYYILHTLPD